MKALIIDDHSLTRDGLESCLLEINQNIKVFQAATLEQAKNYMGEGIDLILLDFWLDDSDGYNSIEALQELFEARIVIFSGDRNQELVDHCIDMDVAGFIYKGSPKATTMGALTIVIGGDKYFPVDLVLKPKSSNEALLSQLAPRQLEMFEMACRDEWSNKKIAYVLEVEESTVKTTLSKCYEKINIKGRKAGRDLF